MGLAGFIGNTENEERLYILYTVLELIVEDVDGLWRLCESEILGSDPIEG